VPLQTPSQHAPPQQTCPTGQQAPWHSVCPAGQAGPLGVGTRGAVVTRRASVSLADAAIPAPPISPANALSAVLRELVEAKALVQRSN
jgi:hypothetical protein